LGTGPSGKETGKREKISRGIGMGKKKEGRKGQGELALMAQGINAPVL